MKDPAIYRTERIRPQRGCDAHVNDESESVVEAPAITVLQPADVHLLGVARAVPEGFREEQLLERQVGEVYDEGWLLRDTVLIFPGRSVCVWGWGGFGGVSLFFFFGPPLIYVLYILPC